MSSIKCTVCGSLTVPCRCVTATEEVCRPVNYSYPELNKKLETLNEYGEKVYTEAEHEADLQRKQLELLDEVIGICEELDEDGNIGTYGLLLALDDIEDKIKGDNDEQ